MTTTEAKRITEQTTHHMLQRRQGISYIVDGDTIIRLGHLTTVQAARKLHDYNVTMANEGSYVMTRTNRQIDTYIDYRCPTCGKVFVHVKPDAPVTHHSAQDHRLEGQRLEAMTINESLIWA